MSSVSSYSVVSNLSRNIYRRPSPVTTESHSYGYVLETGWLRMNRLILGDILRLYGMKYYHVKSCQVIKTTQS